MRSNAERIVLERADDRGLACCLMVTEIAVCGKDGAIFSMTKTKRKNPLDLEEFFESTTLARCMPELPDYLRALADRLELKRKAKANQ